MGTAEKRKVDEECHAFQEKWKHFYYVKGENRQAEIVGTGSQWSWVSLQLKTWGQMCSDEVKSSIYKTAFWQGQCYTDKLCGEWANSKEAECLITTVELLALDKLISVSLSRRTVAELITDVVQDIENALTETTNLCWKNYCWVWHKRKKNAFLASRAW